MDALAHPTRPDLNVLNWINFAGCHLVAEEVEHLLCSNTAPARTVTAETAAKLDGDRYCFLWLSGSDFVRMISNNVACLRDNHETVH